MTEENILAFVRDLKTVIQQLQSSEINMQE